MDTSTDGLQRIVVYATLILGGFLCAAAVTALIVIWPLSPTYQAVFEKAYNLAVVQTLQSVFTTTVATVLTFVLGRPIVAAIVDRLRGR
jgi:hypothetical protein